MVDLPLFPLQPDTFPAYVVRRKPTHSTTVQTGRQGREVGFAQHQMSLWEFELTYDVLRDQTQNIIPAVDGQIAGKVELQKIFELYLASGGQYGEFLFWDSSDNSRLEQQLGTGDGIALIFPFVRSIVGYGGLTVTEQVGAVNISPGLTVSLDGVPVAPGVGTWSISDDLLSLVFVSPPGIGVVITSTFHYYYKCRWISDEQEVEEFLLNIWSSQSVKFRSVNPYTARLAPPAIVPIVPPNPPVPVLSNCIHDFKWWNHSARPMDIFSSCPASQAVDTFGNFYMTEGQQKLKVYSPSGTPIGSYSQLDLADAIDAWYGGAIVTRTGLINLSSTVGPRVKTILEGEYLLAYMGLGSFSNVGLSNWWAVIRTNVSGVLDVVAACYYVAVVGPPYSGFFNILDASNSRTTSDPLLFLGSFGLGGQSCAVGILPSIDDMSSPISVDLLYPCKIPSTILLDPGGANFSLFLGFSNLVNHGRWTGFTLPNSGGETLLYFYFNRAYIDFCSKNAVILGDREVVNVLAPAYPGGCIVKLNLGEIDFGSLSAIQTGGLIGTGYQGENAPGYSVDNANWRVGGGGPAIPFGDEYGYISRGGNIGGTDSYEMVPGCIAKRPSGKYWVIFYMPGIDDAHVNLVGKIYEAIRIFEFDPDTEVATQLVMDHCLLHTANETGGILGRDQDIFQDITLTDEDDGSVTLTVHGSVYKLDLYNFTP